MHQHIQKDCPHGRGRRFCRLCRLADTQVTHIATIDRAEKRGAITSDEAAVLRAQARLNTAQQRLNQD